MNKIKATPDIAGAGVGVLVAFGWNGFVPDYPMSAEVAIPAAFVLGRIIRWAVAWLPEPGETVV